MKCKISLHLKEDFVPLSNSPAPVVFSPGKTLLIGSGSWRGLILGMQQLQDLPRSMHSLQPQSTPCETNSWPNFSWWSSQSCDRLWPVELFLPHVSLPVNLPLIGFSTALWAVNWSLFSNGPRRPTTPPSAPVYTAYGGWQWSPTGTVSSLPHYYRRLYWTRDAQTVWIGIYSNSWFEILAL